MTADVVFLDTETTGLAVTDDIWEIGAIRRHSDKTVSELHMFVEHDVRKCRTLPQSYRADHDARYDHRISVPREDAASIIAEFLDDAVHIVGAVPNFDTERIGILLADFGIEPSWHHHLIDIETLIVGHQLGSGQLLPPLPWKSDELSRVIGIEPPGPGERHTAMGDARWVQRMWNRIMGAA